MNKSILIFESIRLESILYIKSAHMIGINVRNDGIICNLSANGLITYNYVFRQDELSMIQLRTLLYIANIRLRKKLLIIVEIVIFILQHGKNFHIVIQIIIIIMTPLNLIIAEFSYGD